MQLDFLLLACRKTRFNPFWIGPCMGSGNLQHVRGEGRVGFKEGLLIVSIFLQAGDNFPYIDRASDTCSPSSWSSPKDETRKSADPQPLFNEFFTKADLLERLGRTRSSSSQRGCV